MTAIENKRGRYLLKITESGPQIIDKRISFFIFDDRKNTCKSPRRDTIPEINQKANSSQKELKNNNDNNKEKDFNSLIERLDNKITENIKNGKGFDFLLSDPEISIYVNNA